MLGDVPTGFDHALFVVLAVLFPIRASTFGYRRLRLASPGQLPQVRLSVYRQAIALQWGLVAAVVALWLIQRRSWRDLGLVPHLTPGLIGVTLGLAVIVALIVRQRRAALASDEALDDVRRRMAHLERMLPADPTELTWFMRLAVTAGICEELLYRGYLLWYLTHWMGLVQAGAVSAILFGIGHAYQGVRGAVTTGLVGAFLAAVYALSGSIYPPMLVHALMDVHAGQMTYAATRRARERERESAWEDEGGATTAPVETPADPTPAPPVPPPPLVLA